MTTSELRTFTSESVTEGHPDKICDQISDAILDDLLAQDRGARVAVETMVTTGLVHVAGEVRTSGYSDVATIVRDVIRRIGYDSSEKGFDADSCGVEVSIGAQSPDIAQGVDTSFEARGDVAAERFARLGAGDQGLMFGYASRDTPELMPLPIHAAHRLTRNLSSARRDEVLPYLRPDGKTQVSIGYDEDGVARSVDAIVVSTQHSAEVDLDSQLAPAISKVVIAPVLEDLAALGLDTSDVTTHINPSGRFGDDAITAPRWTWTLEELHRPTRGEAVSPQTWAGLVQRLIADELGSLSDPWHHPRAAVNGAMGALRRRVGRLTGMGAFTGHSLARDVLGWFDGDSLALASGPPAERVRLVLALLEAGVISLLGPEMVIETEESAGRFRAASPITGSVATASVLLETRMSKGKIPQTSDPLLRALLDSGRARIHTVDGVQTHSLEATRAELGEEVLNGHNLIAADGTVDETVVVLGIPAASTQPGSAIGATPGVPSPLLAGADVAAKQILARARDRGDAQVPGLASLSAHH